MAQAETWNNAFDAGDDETFDLTFDQDITGWTIYFDLSATDLSKEITSHDDAVAGETSFTLSDTETEGLDGNYDYEMLYETDAGNDETFLKGVFTWV